MSALGYWPNNQFPDVNYYLAWKGYNMSGYSAVMFDDVDSVNITKETPIFAGSRTFDKVMNKLNVNYTGINTYPDSLSKYYNREITKTTLGVAKSKFSSNESPLFVKPILNKQFNGNLWKSFLDLIPLAKIPDETSVLMCEPVKFESEFRVYVIEDEIVGIKHYHGDLRLVPSDSFIKDVIKSYKNEAPSGYAVDVGIIRKELNSSISYIDTVVEVNDGTSLGNYGLDPVHYAELLLTRWTEIVN